MKIQKSPSTLRGAVCSRAVITTHVSSIHTERSASTTANGIHTHTHRRISYITYGCMENMRCRVRRREWLELCRVYTTVENGEIEEKCLLVPGSIALYVRRTGRTLVCYAGATLDNTMTAASTAVVAKRTDVR